MLIASVGVRDVAQGVGHTAAVATKYALFTAASNVAISWVTAAGGWASEFRGLGGRWAVAAGARGALALDALLTFAGIAVLAAMVMVTRRRAERPAPG